MENEDNKLAEEILKEKGFFVMTHKEGSEHVRKAFIEPVIKAMQAYHKAKMKEITDEDIEEHFLKSAWAINKHGEITPRIRHYIEGAKAYRNGEIKHIEK